MNARLLRRLSILIATMVLLAQATACMRVPREVRAELKPDDAQTNHFAPVTASGTSSSAGDEETQ